MVNRQITVTANQSMQAQHAITIRPARLPADHDRLLAVIHEYVQWLDMDLSYRGFTAEMAQFDTLFTLPSGLFLFAEHADDIAGCVGLLRHDAHTAEIKRLYVRPPYLGRQLGQQLLDALVSTAMQLGYTRLVLDAVPQTVVAQQLYLAYGFTEIAPYYANPLPGTRFFGLGLGEHAGPFSSVRV
ncbi:putative N-acetyltransferase YsnE [Andreprevotia sp. IGB-42]|nr:putative N-acetyltransferase YsnE [Andreprevotia sp. IGB-42]